jgi:phytoene dehydrogenase-like protein
MEKTDVHHIVVGSGISGMTAALLLALTGKKVLLLEKAPIPGGSMARFRISGIPFDTGFHFTGGFSNNGLLSDMLKVLGLYKSIEPVFLTGEHANRFMFEQTGEIFDFPAGEQQLKAQLQRYFPQEQKAVERYFELVEQVCRQTRTMDIRQINASMDLLNEDYLSLQTVLDQLTGNPELKTLLSGFSMCYGSAPAEISFANHARMCQGLYQSVARVKDGGDAFIRAFKKAFAEHGVELRCGISIERFLDIRDGQAGSALLTSGETVSFESAILTLHPQEAIKLIPAELMRPAFIHRIQSFEPSAGFFSVFGILEGTENEMDNSIISLFPCADTNRMLDPARSGDSALVIIRNTETVNGKTVQTVSAFEPCFPQETAAWAGSTAGQRPPEYTAYKARKTERIRERVNAFYAGQNAAFKVLNSASVLTFRDYLNSPDGSAYGIRQKTGQFNLIGKLPLRNVYLAGQSSLLPGIVGAMMSSFIVTRAVADKARFNNLICERLG